MGKKGRNGVLRDKSGDEVGGMATTRGERMSKGTGSGWQCAVQAIFLAVTSGRSP